MDLTLERVVEVARAARHRASSVPVVTVAGTNGKGSTCAMLEAIALQAGYRVGLYQKPHLVHFEERCRIDGQPVDGRRSWLPHFAGGRSGARRRHADLVRVHARWPSRGCCRQRRWTW